MTRIEPLARLYKAEVAGLGKRTIGNRCVMSENMEEDLLIVTSSEFPKARLINLSSGYDNLFTSEKWFCLARRLGVRHSFIIDEPFQLVWPQIQLAEVVSASYRSAISEALATAGANAVPHLTIAGSWNSNHVPVPPALDLASFLTSLSNKVPGAVVIPFLPYEECHLAIDSVANAVWSPCTSYTMLEICWSSFDEYLASLPGKGRNTVRTDLERQRRSGHAVSLERAVDVLGYIQPLLAQNEAQAKFLVALAEEFSEQLLAFMVHDGKGVRGVCLALSFGRQLYLRNYGCREDAKKDGYTYFACTYSEPLKHALKNRFRRIHGGVGAEAAKARRGFKVLRQATVLLNSNLATHR